MSHPIALPCSYDSIYLFYLLTFLSTHHFSAVMFHHVLIFNFLLHTYISKLKFSSPYLHFKTLIYSYCQWSCYSPTFSWISNQVFLLAIAFLLQKLFCPKEVLFLLVHCSPHSLSVNFPETWNSAPLFRVLFLFIIGPGTPSLFASLINVVWISLISFQIIRYINLFTLLIILWNYLTVMNKYLIISIANQHSNDECVVIQAS